jgi:hypothetical protein
VFGDNLLLQGRAQDKNKTPREGGGFGHYRKAGRGRGARGGRRTRH